MMADDFVTIGTRGEVTGDKRSLLSLMKAGRMKATYHKDRMLRVRVDGANAVITGEAHQQRALFTILAAIFCFLSAQTFG